MREPGFLLQGHRYIDMTPQQLCITEARSWVGTKWRHRGRNRFGIDCIGLVLKSVGAGGHPIVEYDRLDYSRYPWNDGLRTELTKHFGPPVDDKMPGDVALMRWEGNPEPAHVGILGDYPGGGLSLIHSYSLVSVCEHRLDDIWSNRIVEVYRPW